MKIAVIAAVNDGGTRRVAMDVAGHLRRIGIDAIVAIPGDGAMRAARDSSVTVRSIAWQDVTQEASTSVVPRDGAADLGDCDRWLCVGAPASAPLLPLRPYALLVLECLRRHVPGAAGRSAPRQTDALIATARGASFVIAPTAPLAGDVHGYLGVPAARIHHAPFPAMAEPPMAPARDYVLWIAEPRSRERHHWILDEIRDFTAQGGRLRAREAGIDMSDTEVNDALSGACAIIGGGSAGHDVSAAFDAARTRLPLLANRSGALAHLEHALSLQMQWFECDAPGSLVRQLVTLERHDGAARKSRIAVDELDATWRAALAPWLGQP